MLGYQRDEMIGMHLFQWDAQLTEAALFQSFKQRFEKKERSQFQTVHRRKDGTTFDVEISSYPLELDGQTVLFNSSRDITLRRRIDASLQQQLMFTRALNKISRTFVEQEENNLLLTNTVVNVGTALGADRALIYDVNFKTEQIIGLSEYLNPEHSDIEATLTTYPLALFISGANEMMSTHHWLTSHSDDIEPHLAQDGSGDILHRKMKIRSLLWYPFAFHQNGYHLLALNHVHAKKTWSPEEFEFIESASHLVSFELEKIRLTHARQCADAERDRLLTIIEDAPDFIATSDMQTHLKYLNAAGAKLVGLPEAADLSALKISDMHPAWATKKVLDEAVPIVLELGVWQGETALLHRDGHETPVSQVLLVHRDAAGNPEYLSTIMRDISGLKNYEQALLNNEQNLLNILKLSPIAVRIAVNNGRKVAFCNPRYAELIKSANPLGDDPTKYYADTTAYQLILNELASGNIVLNRMVELNIPDGTTTWALASYMPMQYDGEEAVLGWFYDISDRKQAEVELLRSNVELEQFSYAISHDMRQPLRMISSYLQLLELSLADQLDEENRDYIQFAVDGAKRIDQMLIALLEYSRVG
jgi:PAS domain S-box-containing protein